MALLVRNPSRDDLALHADFAALRHEVSRVRLKNQAAAFVVVLGLAFLSDFTALGDTPAFERILAGTTPQILICALAYVLLEYTALGRRYPVTLSGIGYAIICALGGWVLGYLGGFDGPYFYTVYILPSFLANVPLPLAARAGITAVMVGGFLVGFLLPNPEYLGYPRINIAFNALAGIIAVTVFVGHRAYVLLEQTFSLAKERDRALARAERQGGQLRKHLEAQAARVRALADDADVARSSEREELARTLHDDVGQLLLATRLQLANVDKRLDEAESEDALGALNTLLADLEGSMRGLIGELRVEAAPDVSTLDDSVDSFVRVAREAGLEIELDTLPREAIPERLRAVVGRVVQEGLKNVVKHADAKRAEVALSCDEGWLVATVVDDGRGVAEGVLEDADGWGIVGLRERIERLGGFVELRSRDDGSGAVLEARVPIPRADDERASSRVQV